MAAMMPIRNGTNMAMKRLAKRDTKEDTPKARVATMKEDMNGVIISVITMGSMIIEDGF